MKKRWMPHAVTAGALAVFIVLGLACASSPDSIPDIIFAPTLEELREKNAEGNNLIVVTKTEGRADRGEQVGYGTVYLVTDPSYVSRIRSSINKRNYDQVVQDARWGVELGRRDIAAFSLSPSVREILVVVKYSVRWIDTTTNFYQTFTIPYQSEKSERFYTVKITEKYEAVGGHSAQFDLVEGTAYSGGPYYAKDYEVARQPGFIRLKGIVTTVVTKGGFGFDGEGTITGYKGRSKKVVIPAKINDVPVTAILREAFWNCELTAVTISDGVTSIGQSAFARNELTSVTIGANVAIANNDSFDGNFKQVYDGNGKKAGRYTASGESWTYAGAR